MPYIATHKTSDTQSNSTTFAPGLPAHQADDVLLSLVVRDAQSGAVTVPAGWTAITIGDNTNSITISAAFLVATSAAETPGEYSSTAAQEWSAIVLAIREADTADVIEAVNDNQGAAALTTTPAITTSNTNCLVLHFMGADTKSTPGMLPGAIHVNGWDGASQCFGLFWDFAPTAGAVPTRTFYRERLTNHINLSIAINGDTANIPPHISTSEAPATVIHPLLGSETDTGFGGTFSNDGGSIIPSIDGVTLEPATSYTTGIDKGVFPAHDGIFVRGEDVLIGDLASGKLKFDSPMDLSSSRVIIHTIADNPLYANRMAGVGDNGQVIAFVDTAGAWKAWAVSGVDSIPRNFSQVPIVIDIEDTINMIDSSGTLDATDIDYVVFAVQPAVDDTRVNFSQLQKIGNLVCVGGSSSNPITLTKISEMSSGAFNMIAQQQQGQAQNQLYLVGPIQIGDGAVGTYLDVSGASIEFPPQADETKNLLQYNAGAGHAGVKLYGVSGDHIHLTNSSIYSDLAYHFEIHANSTDAADWDLSGLQVVGAGPIVLNDVGPLGGIAFSRGSTVTLNDCDLSGGCTFSNMESPVVSISTQAELDQLANCSFVDNNLHIQIDVAGSITLSFDNITFSGGLFDIEYTGTGTLTANMVNGSNATTGAPTGGGTINIVTAQTLTLEGIANPSEVRIYDNATGLIEIAGQEDVTTGTFAANIDISLYPSIIIRVLSLAYDNLRIENVDMSQGNVTLPIAQGPDRQFENPA